MENKNEPKDLLEYLSKESGVGLVNFLITAVTLYNEKLNFLPLLGNMINLDKAGKGYVQFLAPKEWISNLNQDPDRMDKYYLIRIPSEMVEEIKDKVRQVNAITEEFDWKEEFPVWPPLNE